MSKKEKEDRHTSWMSFNDAFSCINRIFEEINEPKISKGEFKQLHAKLDFDGDGQFSLKEIKEFISRYIDRQEILMVAIFWVGWTVDPTEKINQEKYKEIKDKCKRRRSITR